LGSIQSSWIETVGKKAKLIEDPEMNPHTYAHLIFDKGAKTIQWKKDRNKWCWFNWQSTCRIVQIDPFLSHCTKLKSKWMKNLDLLIEQQFLLILIDLSRSKLSLFKRKEQEYSPNLFLYW
jgi:hypothetical protein